jgi:hypothetical protein
MDVAMTPLHARSQALRILVMAITSPHWAERLDWHLPVATRIRCAFPGRLGRLESKARLPALRRNIMRLELRLPALVLLSIVPALLLPAASAFADVACKGHELLSSPRPEGSCQTVTPEIFVSPDKAVRALVFPADISLDTTPDMESRVVFRAGDGTTITSKDYSSPRGMNGYYVHRAQWSPDSQFFVYSMMSSGGHSPWSFPIMVFSRKNASIAKFSAMIDGKPTLSGDFKFSGPHTLVATTWRASGAMDDKVPVTVDLEQAFAILPPSER